MKFLLPEEASEVLGGAVTPRGLKRLARERKVEHVRLPGNKIAFTEEQVEKIPALFIQPAESTPAPVAGTSAAGEGRVLDMVQTVAPDEVRDPFGGTRRSQLAHSRKRA